MSAPSSITGSAPTLHSDIFSIALKTVASGLMVQSFELLFDRTDAMGSDTSIIVYRFVLFGWRNDRSMVIEFVGVKRMKRNPCILNERTRNWQAYKCL